MLLTLGSASHTQNELHALLPWLPAHDQATVVRTSHCSKESIQTYLFMTSMDNQENLRRWKFVTCPFIPLPFIATGRWNIIRIRIINKRQELVH